MFEFFQRATQSLSSSSPLSPATTPTAPIPSSSTLSPEGSPSPSPVPRNPDKRKHGHGLYQAESRLSLSLTPTQVKVQLGPRRSLSRPSSPRGAKARPYLTSSAMQQQPPQENNKAQWSRVSLEQFLPPVSPRVPLPVGGASAGAVKRAKSAVRAETQRPATGEGRPAKYAATLTKRRQSTPLSTSLPPKQPQQLIQQQPPAPKQPKSNPYFCIKNGTKHHRFAIPYPSSYDHTVIDHDIWNNAFLHQLRQSVTSHDFGDDPPKNALDLGCGSGAWVIDAARTWPNAHVTGLDIVPLHPDLNLIGATDLATRITWVRANFLEKLPFPDEHFDFVHIRRIGRAVSEDKWDDLFLEISRVMKPGAPLEVLEDDLLFPGGSNSFVPNQPNSSGKRTRNGNLEGRRRKRRRAEPNVQSPTVPYAPSGIQSQQQSPLAAIHGAELALAQQQAALALGQTALLQPLSESRASTSSLASNATAVPFHYPQPQHRGTLALDTDRTSSNSRPSTSALSSARTPPFATSPLSSEESPAPVEEDLRAVGLSRSKSSTGRQTSSMSSYIPRNHSSSSLISSSSTTGMGPFLKKSMSASASFVKTLAPSSASQPGTSRPVTTSLKSIATPLARSSPAPSESGASNASTYAKHSATSDYATRLIALEAQKHAELEMRKNMAATANTRQQSSIGSTEDDGGYLSTSPPTSSRSGGTVSSGNGSGRSTDGVGGGRVIRHQQMHDSLDRPYPGGRISETSYSGRRSFDSHLPPSKTGFTRVQGSIEEAMDEGELSPKLFTIMNSNRNLSNGDNAKLTGNLGNASLGGSIERSASSPPLIRPGSTGDQPASGKKQVVRRRSSSTARSSSTSTVRGGPGVERKEDEIVPPVPMPPFPLSGVVGVKKVLVGEPLSTTPTEADSITPTAGTPLLINKVDPLGRAAVSGGESPRAQTLAIPYSTNLSPGSTSSLLAKGSPLSPTTPLPNTPATAGHGHFDGAGAWPGVVQAGGGGEGDGKTPTTATSTTSTVVAAPTSTLPSLSASASVDDGDAWTATQAEARRAWKEGLRKQREKEELELGDEEGPALPALPVTRLGKQPSPAGGMISLPGEAGKGDIHGVGKSGEGVNGLTNGAGGQENGVTKETAMRRQSAASWSSEASSSSMSSFVSLPNSPINLAASTSPVMNIMPSELAMDGEDGMMTPSARYTFPPLYARQPSPLRQLPPIPQSLNHPLPNYPSSTSSNHPSATSSPVGTQSRKSSGAKSSHGISSSASNLLLKASGYIGSSSASASSTTTLATPPHPPPLPPLKDPVKWSKDRLNGRGSEGGGQEAVLSPPPPIQGFAGAVAGVIVGAFSGVSSAIPQVAPGQSTTDIPVSNVLFHAAPPITHPHDHSFIENAYNEMHAARFINLTPTSLLASAMGMVFKDVRSHPRVCVAFPEQDHYCAKDALSSMEVLEPVENENNLIRSNRGILSLYTHLAMTSPAEVSLLTADNLTISAHEYRRNPSESSSHGKEPSDQEKRLDDWKVKHVNPHHPASPTALAANIVDATAPQSITNNSTLPNKTFHFDLATLNMHLSLAFNDVLACKETIWEFVKNRDGKKAERSEFDEAFVRYEIDMTAQISLDKALEDRFKWKPVETPMTVERVAYDTALTRLRQARANGELNKPKTPKTFRDYAPRSKKDGSKDHHANKKDIKSDLRPKDPNNSSGTTLALPKSFSKSNLSNTAAAHMRPFSLSTPPAPSIVSPTPVRPSTAGGMPATSPRPSTSGVRPPSTAGRPPSASSARPSSSAGRPPTSPGADQHLSLVMSLAAKTPTHSPRTSASFPRPSASTLAHHTESEASDEEDETDSDDYEDDEPLKMSRATKCFVAWKPKPVAP